MGAHTPRPQHTIINFVRPAGEERCSTLRATARHTSPHAAGRAGGPGDHARNHGHSTPAGLTPRQIEMLGLVAGGRTDREIAALPRLSERTVSNHLAHILDKTRAGNRAAAVAFAVRHGLV